MIHDFIWYRLFFRRTSTRASVQLHGCAVFWCNHDRNSSPIFQSYLWHRWGPLSLSTVVSTVVSTDNSRGFQMSIFHSKTSDNFTILLVQDLPTCGFLRRSVRSLTSPVSFTTSTTALLRPLTRRTARLSRFGMQETEVWDRRQLHLLLRTFDLPIR